MLLFSDLVDRFEHLAPVEYEYANGSWHKMLIVSIEPFVDKTGTYLFRVALVPYQEIIHELRPTTKTTSMLIRPKGVDEHVFLLLRLPGQKETCRDMYQPTCEECVKLVRLLAIWMQKDAQEQQQKSTNYLNGNNQPV